MVRVVVAVQLSNGCSAFEVMFPILPEVMALWKFRSSSGCPVVVVSKFPNPRIVYLQNPGRDVQFPSGRGVSKWEDVFPCIPIPIRCFWSP